MTAPVDETAYRRRRVCVTGGAGFIGSHLCDALLDLGATVTVIDDLSNGRRENLALEHHALKLVEGSILDPAALAAAMAGSEIVFHLAAVASVPRSVREPELYHQVNSSGTLHVLEAARTAGTGRLVFASSSSVYGDQPELPKVETMTPDPLSPYAAAKCAAEHLVRSHAHCFGLSAVSLRYFNIFGPRQRPDSPYAAVIPRFAEALCAGREVTVFGDGEQTRDFTFVANAVHANLLAGVSPRELRGQVINVAAGKGRSVRSLLLSIAALIGMPARSETAAPRPGEVEHSHASIDAARELLGYEPIVSFEAGLRETVDSYIELFGR